MVGSAADTVDRRMSRRPSSETGASTRATAAHSIPINIPNPVGNKRKVSNTNAKLSTIDIELDHIGACCAAVHEILQTMSIIQKIATPPALDAKAVITQFKVQRIDESSGFILALPKRVAIGQAPTITIDHR